MRKTPSMLVTALATLVVTAGAAGRAAPAYADEVTSTGRGIAGGALLGAELVTMTEALFDVRAPWAYAVGGGVGAVGGGVGGYFVEQASSDGRAPLYMLGGGIALIIPAVVLTLNATRFRPTAGAREDKPVGPPPDPGAIGGSAVIGAEGAAVPAPSEADPQGTPASPPTDNKPPSSESSPGSLLQLTPSDVRVGMPFVEVRPVFSEKERKQFGMAQVSEVRVPVVRFTF